MAGLVLPVWNGRRFDAGSTKAGRDQVSRARPVANYFAGEVTRISVASFVGPS